MDRLLRWSRVMYMVEGQERVEVMTHHPGCFGPLAALMPGHPQLEAGKSEEADCRVLS